MATFSQHKLLRNPSAYQTAHTLHDLGLNVFPLPHGQKGGYPWRPMQIYRLRRADLFKLFSGQCNLAVMTGRVSGNLFVIDCETEASFEYHLNQLRGAGIPVWAVRSGGRRRGGHFYLRCSQGEVANAPAKVGAEYEIRGTHCYVVAPRSIHPDTGWAYEWHSLEMEQPPLVKVSDVPWLNLSLASHNLLNRTPLPYPELSSVNRDFILHGAAEGERNNRLFKAACDLSGNGYSFSSARYTLQSVALRCGLPEGEISHTIRSAYSQPRRPAKPLLKAEPDKDHGETIRPWQAALLWAEERKWTGRTGSNDRAVFLACCLRAQHANAEGVFRASYREIAEAARTQAKTVGNALKRFIQAGWLVPRGKDRTSQAHLYALGPITQIFQDGSNAQTINLPFDEDAQRVISRPLLPTDAAEHKAMGKAAYRLYEVMREIDEWSRPCDLERAAGQSKGQVARALKKMLTLGVVEKDNHRYRAIPFSPPELDEVVARPRKTLGRGEKRRQQHIEERGLLAAKILFKARFPHRSWRRRWLTPRQRNDLIKQEIARAAVEEKKTLPLPHLRE